MTNYISNEHARSLIRVLDYTYPILLLFFFLAVFTVRSILISSASTPAAPPTTPKLGPNGKPLPTKIARPPAKKVPLDFSKPRKYLFDWLSVVLTTSFVANAANVIVHALVTSWKSTGNEGWWCGRPYVFYVVGAFFVYSLLVISLIETIPAPTTAHLATWTLGLFMELILLGASLSLYGHPHREPLTFNHQGAGSQKHWKMRHKMASWEAIEILIDIIRIVTLASLIAFYLLFVVSRNASTRKARAETAAKNGTVAETTRLLGEPQVQESQTVQGPGLDMEAQQASDRSLQDENHDRKSRAAQGAVATDVEMPFGNNFSEQSVKVSQSQGRGRSLPEEARINGRERQPLLNGHRHSHQDKSHLINGSAMDHKHNSYGTVEGATQGSKTNQPANASVPQQKKSEPPGWERSDKLPSRDWWEYIKGFAVLFPYVWPSKSRRLQLAVIFCVLIMVAQRVVNIWAPTLVGSITNKLAGTDGQPVQIPWGDICLFIALKLCQGQGGALNAARDTIWLPVSQYSYRAIAVAAFQHVHSLSLDFHLGKKTGEVVSALGKGTAINTFLSTVIFVFIPMIVDLVAAIVYFLVNFDSYYALTISIVTFWYIYFTIRISQMRAEQRREMTNADRAEEAVKTDSLMAFETVKYFNAEEFEFKRYGETVDKWLRASWLVNLSLNYMNVVQNTIFMSGFLVMSFIVAYQISTGQQKVGQFTTLLVYVNQLQGPLNFFGTFYRQIQTAMINSERMLELFKERATVVDDLSALPIPSCEGRIDFDSVKFAYDLRKPALNGLSFRINPGQTCAFVGESGGGKSTVFRLLYRFYNPNSGSIQIDGNNVDGITIDSLRRHIGVVPQDTVLFNETIMYNLKYANQEATIEQIHAACRNASIHERIMEFPDGYETKVGERGLRLSGGEKQRVAIARTILKNPRIILLDEATAALDTETEQHIQEAFAALGRGRTMLVIAHRLSTITLADQIIVLHRGVVAEVGTHEELLALHGKYASMWEKQVKAQQAAEVAKEAKDRAEMLRKESMAGSAPESDDEAASAVVELAKDSEKPAGHP